MKTHTQTHTCNINVSSTEENLWRLSRMGETMIGGRPAARRTRLRKRRLNRTTTRGDDNDNDDTTGDRRHKTSALITDYSLAHQRYSCLLLELHGAQCSPIARAPGGTARAVDHVRTFFLHVERRSGEAAAQI